MASIFWKAITPKALNVEGYRKKILATLKDEGKEIRTLLIQPTKTWRTAARFETDTRITTSRALVKVATRDKRYIFLELGTKRRWAVMSSDFRPKTTVRSLRAGRGAGNTGRWGGTLVRGSTHMVRPRPGIKAREFRREVIRIRQPLFSGTMRATMSRAAKDSF